MQPTALAVGQKWEDMSQPQRGERMTQTACLPPLRGWPIVCAVNPRLYAVG